MGTDDDRLRPVVLPPAVELPALASPAGSQIPPGYAPAYDAEFAEAPQRSLRDYLQILYKYRWLALTCFAVTLGLTVVLTLLTPRLYTAATRLQVSHRSSIQLQLTENVLNLDDGDRTVNGTSSFLATQVATLKSRDLAERVIRERRLADNEAFLRPGPGRKGLLEVSVGLLAELRPRGWGHAPAAGLDDAIANVSAVKPGLLDRYMSYLDVSNVRGTDLIEISFTTPSPSLSAFLAAAHAQAYMEANEEARLATDVTAKEFLARQLRESRSKIERAEADLRSFAAEHPNVAVNQEQKVVPQKISELSTMLTAAEEKRVTMQSRYEFLTEPESDALAYFLDQPGIQKLHGALLELRTQRAALDSRLGPNHPRMVELTQQEREIASQLRAEVTQEVAAVRARFDAATHREDKLHDKLAKLEESAIALLDLGARYDLLRRDVATVTDLHHSLLKQQMETAVNSALAASNIRTIERPEVPQHPSKPNVPVDLTLGVLAGLVIALGATFVSEHFDNSVKSSEDVEGLLQLSALAIIPNFTLARRPGGVRGLAARTSGNGTSGDGDTQELVLRGSGGNIVIVDEPTSPGAEAFRSLRTALLFSTPAAPPKTILVTSAGANEGKTVNAVNIASSLAEAGSRVLLIDVDLRKPACHRALGLENRTGISSYLAGQADLASVTHEIEQPRLSFISAGPMPPNPAELVGSERMRNTLARLRDEYDFLILDSPPVVPVTDAVVLSCTVDGVLLVVKGGDTPREMVRRGRDLLLQANAHLLGVVVNNVDLAWGDMYFYNRYYGYYRHQAPEPARV